MWLAQARLIRLGANFTPAGQMSTRGPAPGPNGAQFSPQSQGLDHPTIPQRILGRGVKSRPTSAI
jgi:hypothetical protein